MSNYQDWLIEYIKNNPGFIQPDHRRNETLGFLRKPLEDLCISRPKSRLSWGIELPFDSDYVCYVWFDALINYISAPGYIEDAATFRKWWPATYHLIGKDILTTHTVYWPIMLKAIDIDMPKAIFAHGWWLVGRDKMGKSLGNVVDPISMCELYGTDAFRYFLLAEMTPGNDASFTEKAFIERYNNDLADGLGNMLNRVTRLISRHFNSIIPEPSADEEIDNQLETDTLEVIDDVIQAFNEMKLDRGLDKIMEVIRGCNRYFEQTAPWKLAKDGNIERLSSVLYTATESLRIISALLYPVIPGKMKIMRKTLGISDDKIEPDFNELKNLDYLKPGTKIGDIKSLFPRIEKERKTDKENNNKTPEGVIDMINIDDFCKVKLVTAKILKAEKVEKSRPSP